MAFAKMKHVLGRQAWGGYDVNLVDLQHHQRHVVFSWFRTTMLDMRTALWINHLLARLPHAVSISCSVDHLHYQGKVGCWETRLSWATWDNP